ncbi:MAG TPA: transporter substrate-binding domain-containing protein [Dyella sp.]|uniref:ATP-binding protein n=1 Tax=Dyella sp. TaxID=1869338 RepID=UPI002F947288
MPGCRLRHAHPGLSDSFRFTSVIIFWALLLIATPLIGEPLRVVPRDTRSTALHESYDLHIPLTEQEKAYLAALPTLRIGMDPDWPPYAFLDANGKPDGISADYLDYIVQTLHIRVERVDSKSWADTLRLVNQGQVDILVAMSPSIRLSVPFLPTQPYIDYPVVIATRKDFRAVPDLNALDGLRVAMVADSGVGAAPGLSTAVEFQRMPVGSGEEGLQAVETGKADAFVGNLGVIDRLIRKHHAGALTVAGTTGYSQSIGFGVAQGYEPLQLLMDRVLKAIPEEEQEHIQNTWLSTTLQNGISRRMLWEVLTPIGIVIVISLAILGVIIMYLRKEIRLRRWNEQELTFQISFFRSLMATAPMPVFVKDMEGRYISVNPAFESMVGLKAEAMVGKTARDIHPRNEASNNQLEGITTQVLSTGQSAQGELQYRSNSGQTHDVMYWLRRVNEEGKPPRAMLGVLVDVSRLRAMEREQRMLAESLAIAKQEAEDASRVKDTFLATMSHEIRTPMSGMIGVLDLMNRSRLHPEDQHLLDMSRGAARTLLRILNDVLDFAKSQTTDLPMNRAPFNLRAVIDEVTGLFAPEMQRKGLQFEIFISALTATSHIGDGQRLAQVLLNLVGNALKFTDSGIVGLTVEAMPIDAKTQTQQLSITVRDTGVGISQADQERLFQPFMQVGATSAGGTGLGLVICKRIIEAMGGNIGLRSEPEKGTSVEMTLAFPVAAEETASPATQPTHEVLDDSMNLSVASADIEADILLVEDQPLNRELLARQVVALGVQSFDTASNGLEAWHAFEKHDYALVITDCAMPIMDGEALIRRIRAKEGGSHRRSYVVALTANAMEPHRAACMEAGADEVLVKPIDLNHLRGLLDRLSAARPAAPKKLSLPAGISPEEWPALRSRIVDDMEQAMSALREAVAQRQQKPAWEAAHRILGVARWFQLSDITSASLALETSLGNGQMDDVVQLNALERAVETFIDT